MRQQSTMTSTDLEKILDSPVKFKALTYSVFDNVDLDHSGFIDEDELRQLMIAISQANGSPEPSDEEVR